jgi:hypothetical protein
MHGLLAPIICRRGEYSSPKRWQLPRKICRCVQVISALTHTVICLAHNITSLSSILPSSCPLCSLPTLLDCAKPAIPSGTRRDLS